MKSSSPIVVNSVAEEYEYISRQCCECDGAMKIVKQSFKPVPFEHDTLTTKCEKCSKRSKSVFDVSRFFDKQEENVLLKKVTMRKESNDA